MAGVNKSSWWVIGVISENTGDCRKAKRTEDAEIVGKTGNAKDTAKAAGQVEGSSPRHVMIEGREPRERSSQG